MHCIHMHTNNFRCDLLLLSKIILRKNAFCILPGTF